MRPHDHTVIRRQVHRSATIFLQEHVPLSDYKRKATVPMILAVLLTVTVEVSSIHPTCQRLADLPEGRLTKARALSRVGLGRQGPLSQKRVCDGSLSSGRLRPCYLTQQWAVPTR
jgi:hypothetical protein